MYSILEHVNRDGQILLPEKRLFEGLMGRKEILTELTDTFLYFLYFNGENAPYSKNNVRFQTTKVNLKLFEITTNSFAKVFPAYIQNTFALYYLVVGHYLILGCQSD